VPLNRVRVVHQVLPQVSFQRVFRAFQLLLVPFPWSLAVHHQSLAFRARLYHAKNEAPEKEAACEA